MYAQVNPETRWRSGALAWLSASWAEAIAAQRGYLILWVPVCLAAGIGLWFGLSWEPALAHYRAAFGIGLCALMLCLRAGESWTPVWGAAVLMALGFGLAGMRAHSLAAPVLEFRFYGPIEGRIVAIDRSSSDALRLTLDQVRLDDVAPARTPARVRVSLHGDQGFVDPIPGLRVILTGHLSPPGGPVEPGGFDFQRMAWFRQLGAVGYTRTPVLALSHPEPAADLAIFQVRRTLFDAVQERITGPPGAFVAAVLTGDRSALPRADLDALRGSNLAHLLAISGLHMGLLTGVVFGALRFAMAAIPWVALRWPTKKVAAAGALVVGATYLLLSGGNVATIRAFIMVSVMLVAILAGRRAISLRSVAVAAILILVLMPESLSSAGFQMSFAATVGLVAVFGAIRDHRLSEHVPRWALPILGVVLSSGVAGLATAPIGAAHFNTLSDYGLLANLLSVPVMGTVVMPAAVAAALLVPFGLDWIAFEIMRLGTQWILAVAHWVSGLEGARTWVQAPPELVLPLFALAALFWICWQGRLRHVGALGMVGALGLWGLTDRPDILIAESGGLVGIMTPEGRSLSKPKGDGFVARVWLENDGDDTTQQLASGRPGPWTGLTAQIGGTTLVHATGRALKTLPTTCALDEVWIVPKALSPKPSGPCQVFDAEVLRHSGAVAVYVEADKLRFVSARDKAGTRLWNTPALRRAVLEPSQP